MRASRRLASAHARTKQNERYGKGRMRRP